MMPVPPRPQGRAALHSELNQQDSPATRRVRESQSIRHQHNHSMHASCCLLARSTGGSSRACMGIPPQILYKLGICRTLTPTLGLPDSGPNICFPVPLKRLRLLVPFTPSSICHRRSTSIYPQHHTHPHSRPHLPFAPTRTRGRTGRCSSSWAAVDCRRARCRCPIHLPARRHRRTHYRSTSCCSERGKEPGSSDPSSFGVSIRSPCPTRVHRYRPTRVGTSSPSRLSRTESHATHQLHLDRRLRPLTVRSHRSALFDALRPSFFLPVPLAAPSKLAG